MNVESPLNPASPLSGAISHLFVIVLLIAMAIFVIVAGLVAYIAVRYRRRPGDREPRQVTGNFTLEIIWTAIPVAILAVILVLTVRTIRIVNPPVERAAPDVELIAHQWWWEVRYPKSGAITANEIHIPTGTRLLFRIESADVIHDFWVPRLAHKVDAIPGHPNHVWVEADTPGTYLGSCNEYCGIGHAWMLLRVIAQPRPDFEAWERAQFMTAAPPSGPEAVAGAKLFQDKTCANCHTIAGSAANGTVGPDLTHVASRETLASGAIDNTTENLEKWLANPESVKPSLMPNLHLSAVEVRQLAAYLEELR
jgi:cytochrome c oxidase subunit II